MQLQLLIDSLSKDDRSFINNTMIIKYKLNKYKLADSILLNFMTEHCKCIVSFSEFKSVR